MKKHKTTAVPAKAVCSQKMSRQDRNVTMIPPMKGPFSISITAYRKNIAYSPRAGPINVPDMNQPNAVPRSVWVSVSSDRAVAERLPSALAVVHHCGESSVLQWVGALRLE